MQDHGGQGYALGTAGNISARVEGETIVCHYPVSQTVSHDEAGGCGIWMECGVGTL